MSEQTGSWQPDPFGRHQYRYWDGAQWSDQVSNDGVVQTDPPVGDPAGGVTEEPAADAPAADEPVAAGSEPEPAPAADEPAGWAASSEPDATTSMPAASYPPPTVASPGGPGGPADPIYRGQSPDDSGDGGKRSKAPIVIIILIILALAAGAAAYFLLMGDDDEEVRGDLIASLQDEEGLSESEAECVVDALGDDLDLNELAEAIEADEVPTAEQITAYANARTECGLDDSASPDDDTTTTEPDDDTTTTEPDDDGPSAGGIDMPPAMIALMAEQVADELGITTEQAECFIEGVFSGLDEDDFDSLLTDPEAMDFDSMSNVFQVFEDCDIDPSEIEGGGDFDDPGSSDSADTYGDDPALDILWDACEGGEMEACDDLYFDSPFGSEYETFGDTCGGRQEAATGNLCSEEFG